MRKRLRMCKAKCSKTLFVSDLDGTLLNHNQTLSDKTRATLNSLIGEGLCFTYATARSLTSAREVTQGLNLKLPVIVYNGACVQEADSGNTVIARQFSFAEKSKESRLYRFANCNNLQYKNQKYQKTSR